MRRRAPCVRVYALENCAWARYTTRYICTEIWTNGRKYYLYLSNVFNDNFHDEAFFSLFPYYILRISWRSIIQEFNASISNNFRIKKLVIWNILVPQWELYIYIIFRNYFQMLKYIFKEEKKRFTRKIHGIIPRRKGNIYFYFMKKKIYFLQPWCWNKTLQDTLVTCVGQRQTWNVFS